MDSLLKIFSVIAMSSVKFLGGPLLSIAYDYGFFETIAFTVVGGMIGVFIISALSKRIMIIRRKMRINSSRPKKIFTSRNRRIVKYWRKYGLFGLAFLTPVLISIPIGTFIATKYISNRKKVFVYMFFSIIFWSILITSLLELPK